MNDPRFAELLEAHLDGRLTPAEAEELGRQLVDSPQDRRIYWEIASLDALAREATVLDRPSRAAPVEPVRPTLVRGGRWFGVAVLAGVLCVGLTTWLLRPVPVVPPPAGIAVVATAVAADGSDSAGLPVPGSVLVPGKMAWNSGIVGLEMFGGARLVVTGPAELQLISPQEIRCLSGRLTAYVPEAARGFTVSAPGLTVIDLGTEFGLSVSPSAPAEVHVFTGKVSLSRPDVPAPRELKEGEAVRVEGPALVSIPPARDDFVTEAELDGRSQAESRRRRQAWNRGAAELARDPNTLLYYDFRRDPADVRSLANRAADGRAATAGSIVGCRWAEGRWPGKEALELVGPGDRVRFTASAEMHAVTLLAWVRIEALPHGNQALIAPDGLAPGTLRWSLTDRGELRLGVARDLGRPEPDWEVVIGTPAVTPERLGRWLLLATTFDGTRIHHYCNGEPAGSGVSFRPDFLVLGPTELGNRNRPEPRRSPICFDEFLIASRVFTPEEIRKIHEIGSPTGFRGGD